MKNNNSTKLTMDSITYLLSIKACMNTIKFEKGKEIHLEIPFNILTIELNNTLIDFYGHVFDIDNALLIYNGICDNNKTIITIGAMLESYCNCNMYSECIEMFKNINNITRDVQVNNICYSIVFKACTKLSAFHCGKEIHNKLINDKKNNYLLNDNYFTIN